MATQTTKELDALYVTIRVEDKPFLQSAQAITSGLDTLEKKFVSFGQNVSAAFSGGMKDASRSLANIGRFIDAVSTLVAGKGGVKNIGRIIEPLKSFAQRFNAEVADELANTDTQTATKTLSKLASFLRVVRDLPANIDLSGVTTPLKDFAVAFKRDVASVLNGPEVMDASKALANISRFLGVFKSETFDASRIKDISSPLKSFAENFKNDIASFMTGPDVQSATTALSRVGSFLRALSGLPDTKTLNAKTHGMAGILQTMFGSLAATAQNNAGFDLASKTVGRLANFARSMMKFDVNVLAGQIDPIKNFVAGIGGADATKAAPVADVLNKIGLALNRLNKHAGNTSNFNTIGNDVATLMAVFGRAASWAMSAKTTVDALGKVATVLNRVAKVNVNAATAAGQATLAVMNSLNALTVGPNVNASLAALERLSKVMGRVSRAGQRATIPPVVPPVAPPGGGRGGSWFGWLGGFFGGGPSLAGRLRTTAAAANTGGNSFGLLGRNIEYTADRADRLIGALTSTHALIVGIGTIAGRQFGALDDALTRLAAHSQDWEQSNRGMLQSAVMDLSGRSRTGAVDLAKGLDILTSNGMSAAMAMKAMGIAENFALSSGMEMEAATRRIVDVQRNLGMNSENVAEHYANMTRLSDIFVGVAPKVGSTVDQLSEAFRGRFAGAMHSANMSMEEGIAMMGALSTIGGRFRGGTGGEFGARLLGITSVLNANNEMQWKALLGRGLYDEGGKMLPIDQIADLLTERLGTEGSKQRTARIVGAGFKSENVNVLSALIGLGPEIRKVLAEIEKVGGVSAKSADLMRRTFMGQMTTLYNNAINVATVLGERLAPIIFVFTDAIASAAKWFTALNPAIQQLVVSATAAAFAAYPLYLALTYIGGLALKPFFMIGSAIMNIARFAMFAGSAILGLAVSIASFAISSVMFAASAAISIAKGVIGALITINSVVGNAIYTVADAAVAAGKAIGHALGSVVLFAIGAIIDAFHFFSLTFRQMVDVVRDLGAAVWKVGLNAVVALGSLLFSLFTSILPLIISVVAAIMALPFILMAVSAAGAALAAVVVTLGVGMAQLGVAIGGGLLALWAGFKAAIAGTFAWIAGKMDDLREGAVGVWSSFKAGAAEALVNVGNALSKIAGFFWNIRENAKVVGEWWSANWKAAIEDIGEAAARMIENTASNALKILSAFGRAMYAAFQPIGVFLEALFLRSLSWFEANWKNMLSDAATIFKTFVFNVAQNFLTLLPIFDAIGNYIINRLAGDVLSGSTAEKDLAKIKYEIAYAMGDVEKMIALRPDMPRKDVIELAKTAPGLRGPLDNLPGLKTRGSDLGSMWSAITGSMGEQFGAVPKEVWGIFKDLGKNLSPLLGADFEAKAPWDELMSKLNLKLPEGFMGPLLEAFTGSTRKVVESEGAGQMIGKGGPGWTFRQTSMARMEVGGEFATNLERQQLSVLQAIQRDTAVIAAANKDMKPAIFKPMKPVREGGD